MYGRNAVPEPYGGECVTTRANRGRALVQLVAAGVLYLTVEFVPVAPVWRYLAHTVVLALVVSVVIDRHTAATARLPRGPRPPMPPLSLRQSLAALHTGLRRPAQPPIPPAPPADHEEKP